MIPYWRYVEYTEDGCALYQCLMCMVTWESRTSPGNRWGGNDSWIYCPYCGYQWEDQLECRSHEMPRWRYELDKKGIEFPFDRCHSRDTTDREWCIIERTKWPDQEWSDWKFERSCTRLPIAGHGKAVEALSDLRYYTDRIESDPVFPIEYEYKVARIKKDSPPFHHVFEMPTERTKDALVT